MIFAAEVVGSVLAFVFYPQTETTVIASFKEYQIKNGSEVRNAASYAWDALQRSVSLLDCTIIFELVAAHSGNVASV